MENIQEDTINYDRDKYRKCKYCDKLFKKSSLGGHVSRCPKNPDRKKNCEKFKDSCARANKAQIQKKNIIPRDLICERCGKHYTLTLSEHRYKKGKYSHFCSRSCANSRGKYNDELKQKISNGVKKHLIDIGYVYVKHEKLPKKIKDKSAKTKTAKLKKKKIVTKICEFCGKEFQQETYAIGSKYCCEECRRESLHIKMSAAGKKSAAKQGAYRRSKNEKLFCEKCEKCFVNVGHNEPIFNGWDADILIHDLKIAVLWNGPWHYKKITKSHSIKQVKNRDKIKINEILKSGWIPYIIKDMGKYNPKFVDEQFEIFLDKLNSDENTKLGQNYTYE